jgi:hypothetical protein
VSQCVHHWRLTEPDGPIADGKCLRCGASRRFSTVFFGDASDPAAIRRRIRPLRERRQRLAG